MGVRVAAAGPVPRCAPKGAASNQTFCPSDLPVKKSRSRRVAWNRYGSFCDSGCGLAAPKCMNPEYDRHAKRGENVMLAQASMASAVPLIRRRDIQVSASPTLGVHAALAALARTSPPP
jgi:hypothetical protein